MHLFEPNFEKVLKDNTGLLKHITGRLSRKYKYRKVPRQDIYSMVQTAAWNAWKAQKRHTNPNGESPYKFGTYMNFHLQLAEKAYSELDREFYHRSTVIPETVAAKQEIVLTDILDILPSNQRKVIEMRFFDKMTLVECAKVMKISPETVRLLQNHAINRMKKHATKS